MQEPSENYTRPTFAGHRRSMTVICGYLNPDGSGVGNWAQLGRPPAPFAETAILKPLKRSVDWSDGRP